MPLSKIFKLAQTAVPAVEWNDIQAIVRSQHANYDFSSFLPFRFATDDDGAVRLWLQSLLPQITRAAPPETPDPHPISRWARWVKTRPVPVTDVRLPENKPRTGIVVNLILSASGLSRLMQDDDEIRNFSEPFRNGMAQPDENQKELHKRASILGDVGDSAVEHWRWSDRSPGRHAIDGMLLIYADTKDPIDAAVATQIAALRSFGLDVVYDRSSTHVLDLRGTLPKDRKENFGFRDGVSQPILESDRGDQRAKARKEQSAARERASQPTLASVRNDQPANVGSAALPVEGPLQKRALEQSIVKTGEFVLGYKNERDLIAGAIGGRLSPYLEHGTYVVIRELQQDPEAFSKFSRDVAHAKLGSRSAETSEWIKSRLMGRSAAGSGLSSSCETPFLTESVSGGGGSPPGALGNDFLFHPNDRHGLSCPLGSHIRRANPRDSLGPDPGTAFRLAKMHRIIRRGRVFGNEDTIRHEPAANDTTKPAKHVCGLYFVALNADIEGQFEHIQQNWINNDRFAGLNGEIDPISHFRRSQRTSMTIQRRPFNIRITNIPTFVTVRGGGYFFLPGLRALERLAQSH